MEFPQKILVSACLLNEPVRYNNELFSDLDPRFKRWFDIGVLIIFCPECEGGLSVPRDPCEIKEGSAERAWKLKTGVVTNHGKDLTEAFITGAEKAWDVCRENSIKFAVLKARSPSCGSRRVYDGTFQGKLVDGDGMTAFFLKEKGIEVFDETELDQLEKRSGLY